MSELDCVAAASQGHHQALVFVTIAAVLSGLGTDGDDAACPAVSRVVQSGLFRDFEPDRQKRYLGTLRTICVEESIWT